MKTHALTTLGIMAMGMTASATFASDDPLIYATNHLGLYPGFGDTLIKFNASDPAGFTTIGELGNNLGFGGLEFDADGNLWAYATHNSFGGAVSGLYKVDLETGAATVQGTPSSQSLTDLAWNPTNDTMYGVYSQSFTNGRLFEVNLETGSVTIAGEFSGLDAQNNLVGLAIDSDGLFYVFDNMNKKLYRSDAEFNLTLLYGPDELTCPQCELAIGSQGIGIDWSRHDVGYHGAIGQGVFPNYYNNLNTFDLDGAQYTWGPDWGPNHPDGLPQVQPGDLAILPNDARPQIPGDLNGDGVVDVSDVLLLLGAWGPCPEDKPCTADLNGDGVVDVTDLLILLANWG